MNCYNMRNSFTKKAACFNSNWFNTSEPSFDYVIANAVAFENTRDTKFLSDLSELTSPREGLFPLLALATLAPWAQFPRT